MKILLVDDEALARSRLKTLIADCRDTRIESVIECADAAQALKTLEETAVDLVFLDIHMPGLDGLALAQRINQIQPRPAVVFVTAHPEHAVKAFDLEATDYLTKPVRLERLRQALNKCPGQPDNTPASHSSNLVIHERGRTVLVPISEVIYFKAELKYITVRTHQANHLLEASLSDLEEKYASQFLRVHRNALVLKSAIRRLEKGQDDPDNEGGEGWNLFLQGIDEPVAVSRRQLSSVKDLLRSQGN